MRSGDAIFNCTPNFCNQAACKSILLHQKERVANVGNLQLSETQRQSSPAGSARLPDNQSWMDGMLTSSFCDPYN